MALVGLVRVSTSKQETRRQHEDLGPTCVKVFREKSSGKLNVADRPALPAALDYMRLGDILTVQEDERSGRNLLERLLVLNDLFEQGLAVKMLDGIAGGKQTERSLLLDVVFARVEGRRRGIVSKTRYGLESAARHGRKGGRPRVVNVDERHASLTSRTEGQSLPDIARDVRVSLAVVHGQVMSAEIGERA